MAGERPLRDRLVDAVWMLVLFEVSLLLRHAGIALIASIALPFVIGAIIRVWLFVPLVSVVFLLMLNIHVLIFGEIVTVAPEDEHLAGMAYFFFGVAMGVATVITACAGTASGKLIARRGRSRDRSDTRVLKKPRQSA
jgi:hypothetical protein